jgi:RNA polymerase sigma-70 factor (ECF subfamily)
LSAVPERAHDEEVLGLLRRGAPEALDRFTEVFGERMRSLAGRILADEREAEEAVQEACVTVWRKWSTFRGDCRFSSWVYRVTANEAYMKLRRLRGHEREQSLDGTVDGLLADGDLTVVRVPKTPEEETEWHEIRDLIVAEVRRLPASSRLVYFLKEVQGFSIEEVAQVTGLHESAVKTRVHRARLTIRARLGARLRGPGAAGPGGSPGPDSKSGGPAQT